MLGSSDLGYLIQQCVWIFQIKSQRGQKLESLSELCLLPLIRTEKKVNLKSFVKPFSITHLDTQKPAYIKEGTFFPDERDFCVLQRWNFMSDACCNLFGNFPSFRQFLRKTKVQINAKWSTSENKSILEVSKQIHFLDINPWHVFSLIYKLINNQDGRDSRA